MTEPLQSDFFKAETTWFHLFRNMFTSGDVKKISPYGFTIYGAIKCHASFQTGESFPSHEKLSELTGISESQIKRALKDLADTGYLTIEKKGRKNVYKLREKVALRDEHGRPAAVATWDYVPGAVQAAMADLRNVLMTGDFAGAKIVNISHMTLNVNNGSGTQVNVDMSMVADAATKKEVKDIIKQAARVTIIDEDEEF